MDQDIQQQHKIAPKLRMIANGDVYVNSRRAETSQCVAITDQKVLHQIPSFRGYSFATPGAAGPNLTTDKVEEVSRDDTLREIESEKVLVNVFVEVRDEIQPERVPENDEVAQPWRAAQYEQIASQAPLPIKESLEARLPPRDQPDDTEWQASRFNPNLLSATVTLDQLAELAENPAIVSIEVPDEVRYLPPLYVALAGDDAVTRRDRVNHGLSNLSAGDVLIGIVDVGGFDFSHPDFLDANGDTRFYRIWDQGGRIHEPPENFNYGSEITQEHMNNALHKAPEFSLPATRLEPQSQMMHGSHATHVTSIAAGNGGVCPHATIAAVLLSIPFDPDDELSEHRASFYDSSRLAHAVDYLFGLGQELGMPVVINISLGTNGHAHDGSSIVSRWVDHSLMAVGRAICVAAGNAGQENPLHSHDLGYLSGRVHTTDVLKTDQSKIIEWVVGGDGVNDFSENELEIWYSPRDRFLVEVKPPGEDWLPEVIKPGEFQQNRLLANGTRLSVYNELYAAANGQNYIGCYLSPNYVPDNPSSIQSGTWAIRLTGLDVRDGEYHGWIERDDPFNLGGRAWRFPSAFGEKTFSDNSTVSSLACGQRVISVANYDAKAGEIHYTSSQGPTRDHRLKPDVCAPGTDIVAANGFDLRDDWISMTGTSMASPFVTGVVAHMLTEDPRLSAAQINGILQRTAKPLDETNFDWSNGAGFGVIQPEACLMEVRQRRTQERAIS